MAKHLAALLCLFAGPAHVAAQSPTMLDNFRYRASWGDLGPLVPAPLEKLRALRIESGSNVLLDDCLAHPEKWHRDPWFFRFGHGHPFTTVSCRERSSPSLHAVFYREANGTRQAWIHFDRYSPGNLPGHAAEVLQNRLTFGRTSQIDIYRELVLRRSDASVLLPPPHYDVRHHAEEYWQSTFSPHSLLPVALFGGESVFLDGVTQYEDFGDNYARHLEANLFRHVAMQTTEWSLGMLLQQDETFAVSRSEHFAHRVRSALYHSFFVAGRNGNELAFPRLAAATGTAWITHEWHPWQTGRTDPWRDGSLLLSSYVARSFWHEFKPDIKREFGLMRHRL